EAECRERCLGCCVSCAKRVVDGHIGRHVRYARPGIDSRERRAWRRPAGREKPGNIGVGLVVKAEIVGISKEVPARSSAIRPLEVPRVYRVHRDPALEFEAATDFPGVQQSPGSLLSWQSVRRATAEMVTHVIIPSSVMQSIGRGIDSK